MKTYKPDTTASAVTIYKNVIAKYEYKKDAFIIEYNYENKIKILKSEGVKYANIVIPIYDKDKSDASKEFVSKIEAYAYNMEDGKIKKTKMDKSYIFEERVNPYWKQVKFSIPAVKEGTVIEYRYKLTSEFPDQIADCVFQQDIPVIYSNYDIQIPLYFDFNAELRGKDQIKVAESIVPQTILVEKENNQSFTVGFNCRRIFLTVINLPAIKDEPNVWCSNDYRAKVTFELKGTQFPDSEYKPYTSTWENIDELLKKEEDFGGILNMKNPYREEMRALNITSLPTITEKTRATFQFLKTKISWDGNYRFYGNDVKKAIKSGTGSNADFNFVLISMLKDAGINAFPVMMSKRDDGRLPLFFPSVYKLNTFVVGINDTDSTNIYLDSSVKNGDINILPPVLMVDRARIYNENGKGSWVNLNNIGKHSVNILISGSISPEGIIKGEKTASYTGEQAAGFRNAFHAAKDSVAFIEKTESEDGISIKECSIKDINSFSSRVQEKLSFTKEASANAEYIYLNPMIFPHLTKNQFTAEDRKLPIEFDYPYTFQLASILTLPEGYQVEEMPKPVKINLEKEECTCIYNVQSVNNQIMVRYTFTLKKILYTKDEYTTLRKFWGSIVNKNNELIVLKKVGQQTLNKS
nr:DUF3857 domain-containing protein [uncultured Bacteroides sp.]